MATAIALEQAGLDPVIYEQSPELVEIGAGIGMHANAMRVLARFGAADFVREHGVRVDAGEWRRLEDGRTIATQEYAGLAERYGDHYICMHRADLLESLVRAVPSHRINLGSRLIGVEERAHGVIARFENGDEAHGDLLVGADGLRSTVRTLLFGEAPTRFTGFAAWRGVIPIGDMPPGFERLIVTWPGPGRHGMTYPIRPDTQIFNGFVPTTEILREEWGPSGELDDLRRSFDGVCQRGPGDPRADHLGPDQPDPLPRPAPRLGNRAHRADGRRRAPDAAERRTGRRDGARGRRHTRGMPAARGRTGRRDGGARRIRGTPPGAHRRDARRGPHQLRHVQRARPGADARARRAASRPRAARPRRQLDVRLALRPRRDRRRPGAGGGGGDSAARTPRRRGAHTSSGAGR